MQHGRGGGYQIRKRKSLVSYLAHHSQEGKKPSQNFKLISFVFFEISGNGRGRLSEGIKARVLGFWSYQVLPDFTPGFSL